MPPEVCLRSHPHCPCPMGDLVDGLCHPHRQARASEQPARLVVPARLVPPAQVAVVPAQVVVELAPDDFDGVADSGEWDDGVPDYLDDEPHDVNESDQPDRCQAIMSRSGECVCFVCGSQIFARIDGPKFYKRAMRKAVSLRRCRECRGVQTLVSTGLVDANSRYEDDPVAQAVVAMYPEGVPSEIVAELFGISRGRVSQIEERALRKIRTSNLALHRELLALFLDTQSELAARKKPRDYGLMPQPRAASNYLLH